MNAAKRNAARRGWPTHLYEHRPGYYTFRDPRTGKELVIGRVTLAQAKAEAIAVNNHIAGLKPTLLERVAQAGSTDKTISQALELIPKTGNKNTEASHRTLDKRINAAIGGLLCRQANTMQCADFLRAIWAEGKERTAEAARARLIAAFNEAASVGACESNPALPTKLPAVKVRRGRLTLESYLAIRAKADEQSEYLGHAMDIALVTGADVSTVAGLMRKNIDGDWLDYVRGKTKCWIRVHLDLELRCAGLKLRDVLRNRSGVVSPYIIHHARKWGNAPIGSRVHENRLSRLFTEARKAAGIPDAGAPTFHELRSLSKRLYDKQGNVNTKDLLGHSDAKTASIYANARGAEALEIRMSNEQQVNSK